MHLINTTHKKFGVPHETNLTSRQEMLLERNVTRGKERYFIIIKCLIHHVEITILNAYLLKRPWKIKHKFSKLKGESFAIIFV